MVFPLFPSLYVEKSADPLAFTSPTLLPLPTMLSLNPAAYPPIYTLSDTIPAGAADLPWYRVQLCLEAEADGLSCRVPMAAPFIMNPSVMAPLSFPAQPTFDQAGGCGVGGVAPGVTCGVHMARMWWR